MQKIKDFLNNCYQSLYDERWVLLFFIFGLLLVPIRLVLEFIHLHLIYAVPFSVTFSCLLVLAGKYMGKVGRAIWFVVWEILIYGTDFMYFVLHKVFGLSIKLEVLALVFNTDKREVADFFSLLLSNYEFWKWVVFFIIVLVAQGLLIHCKIKFTLLLKKWVKVLTAVLFVWGIPVTVWAVDCVVDPLFFRMNAISRSIRSIPLIEFPAVLNLYMGIDKWSGTFTDHIDDVRLPEGYSSPQTDERIILIVGESDSRLHSSLYDYRLQTAETLGKWQDSLLVFTNVTSTDNYTMNSYPRMFSPASVTDTIGWYAAPPAPSVFKHAGWNAVFDANQTEEYGYDMPEANTLIYNKVTMHDESTDRPMIDSLVNAPMPEAPLLSVIHLVGQHMVYKNRFNEEDAVYTPDYYTSLIDLSKTDRKIVANYDNATRSMFANLRRVLDFYKDENAIIIYVPDHGEVVFEYGHIKSRVMDLAKDAPMSYETQMHIPMYVYMTPRWRASHPEKAEAMRRAVDLPYSSDHLPHLLFGLADIPTGWYRPERDLLSEQYDTTMPRLRYNGEPIILN